MSEKSDIHLSRRERQIMDIVYRRGEASAAEVLGELPEPPSYSAVRAMLRILEDKGHLTHQRIANRYVYSPKRSRREAGRSAVQRLLRTFFDGSTEQAVAALLEAADTSPSSKELDRMAHLIEQARKEGR